MERGRERPSWEPLVPKSQQRGLSPEVLCKGGLGTPSPPALAYPCLSLVSDLHIQRREMSSGIMTRRGKVLGKERSPAGLPSPGKSVAHPERI